MTTAIPVHLANRPTQEPVMQHQPTAGATIRVTFDATVQHIDGRILVLTTGARIDPSVSNVHVLEPGYQPGDTARHGDQRLFRITPQDGSQPYWIAADGHVVQDSDVHPAQLRISPAVQDRAEAQQ